VTEQVDLEHEGAMTYAEIHFHLLPGIDDGPPSLDASVKLASAAAADGTVAIFTTPHVHPEHVTDVTSLPELVREVTDRLRRWGIAVDVHCGGEVDLAMVGRLSDAELDVIAGGPPGARWLLLESPFSGLGPAYTEAADELRARGFGVVMAHPERAMADPAAGWAAVAHEVDAGSAIQINAWSVCGRYGDRVRADALRIARTVPHVALASDAHGLHRPPYLTRGFAELICACPAATVRRIAGCAPRLLAHGLPGREALAA
jgi:protein-tyrosine phosphatase